MSCSNLNSARPRNLIVLPLRGGSKRILHKNRKLIGGRHLFEYQLDVALQVKGDNKIVVASDDLVYRELVRGLYGDSIQFYKRSPRCSDDKASIESVILEMRTELGFGRDAFDNVVILQATQPFNQSKWVNEALEILVHDLATASVISVYPISRFKSSDLEVLKSRPRSQEFYGLELETGNFWVTRWSLFIDSANRVVEPIAKVEVDKLAGMLDVDDELDLFIVDKILTKANGRYFKTREMPSADYDDYWKPKPDPDGRLRDLREEKNRKIEFCKEEIEYVNQLCLPKGSRLLDLGAGPGFCLSAISDLYEKYALEVSESALEVLETIIDKKNIHVGPLAPGVYAEEFFDVVFCSHVIEHVLDPLSFLSQIYRVLKTGGVLVVSTPNFDSPLARLYGEKYRMLHDQTHVSLFSDLSLFQALQDFGFEILEVRYPYFDTDYVDVNVIDKIVNRKDGDVSPPFVGNVMTFYCAKK